MPLVLLGLVAAHLIALHEVGSNNPDGVEIKNTKDAKGHPVDGIPFHPYYTVHDLYAVSVFLFIFSAVLFFAPEGGGYFLEFNNFIEANPLKTPAHIAPVWYFTPYYSMLRATTDLMVYVFMAVVAIAAILAILRAGFGSTGKIVTAVLAIAAVAVLKYFDAKFWGVVVMGGAVLILFVLPWLDRSPVKSIRYRPDWHKVRVRRLRHLLPRPRLPRLAAAIGRRQLCLADRHAGLFRLLPADAVVEPHRHLQAGARARFSSTRTDRSRAHDEKTPAQPARRPRLRAARHASPTKAAIRGITSPRPR